MSRSQTSRPHVGATRPRLTLGAAEVARRGTRDTTPSSAPNADGPLPLDSDRSSSGELTCEHLEEPLHVSLIRAQLNTFSRRPSMPSGSRTCASKARTPR